MLVYFNKENKLQQQCNFIVYSMCCNNEIQVALYPRIVYLTAFFSLLQPCLWNLFIKKSTLAKRREEKISRGNTWCYTPVHVHTHTHTLSKKKNKSIVWLPWDSNDGASHFMQWHIVMEKVCMWGVFDLISYHPTEADRYQGKHSFSKLSAGGVLSCLALFMMFIDCSY